MRECNKLEANMLQNVYDETKKLHKQNDNEKEICWFNLYLQGEYSDKFTVMSTIKDEFAAWVESLIKEFYPYEVRNIISYGFIHSPKNASRDQPWHLDYGHQVSNLFIPLNELTSEAYLEEKNLFFYLKIIFKMFKSSQLNTIHTWSSLGKNGHARVK